MDSLESICVHTYPEDEYDFFTYLLQDQRSSIIPKQIGIGGPTPLTIAQIAEFRNSEAIDTSSLLIWNSFSNSQLCWSPFNFWYDATWQPIPHSETNRFRPSIKSPWSPIRSVEQWLAIQHAFQQISITESIFAHGHVLYGQSPVIELNLPGRGSRFTSLTAHFYEIIGTEVWLVWNSKLNRWEHNSEDPETIYNNTRTQPHDVLAWQEHIFDWIRSNWSQWIIPRYTYRLGPESLSFDNLAQNLADASNRNVSGINPRPPIISPRDQEEFDGSDQ